MKILFVVKSKTIETLGPMYLAAVAKAAGHEAKIWDINNAETAAELWKPDVLAYSVMTGDQERMKDVNCSIRRNMPSGQKQPKSIFGGPHVTFFPEDFLIGRFVDATFYGESESEFALWLAGRSGDTPIFPDINSLPWPDRTDFPNHKIRDFITSRGCPYNCSYCYNDRWNQLFAGNPVRTRDVDDVIKEIMSVKPEFAYFQDSCFGVKMDWLREFSHQYRRHVKVPFHCHLRPVQVTEDRVLLLYDANCASVRIALETASPKLLKLLNREKTDLNQVADAVRLLKKWHIKLMIQNMIGLPTGTIRDDLQTLEFNIRCRPDYGWVSIFQPYPGTKLGDWCKKEGWYTGNYSEISDSFFDGSVLEFNDVYKEQLQCLQKIWALAVECQVMPKEEELTMENFPKLVHRITRALGDRRMYPGVM